MQTRLGMVTEKLRDLIRWFEGRGSVIVAFSGGVDSTLVAVAAKIALGDSATAVTMASATLAKEELAGAIALAKALGLRHVIVGDQGDLDPLIAANPATRCYFCRSDLAAVLKEIAGREAASCIVDGTNLEDLHDYRPGLIALKEAGVLRPLVDTRFSKAEVRAAAKLLGLPNADKAANACLASRIPHWNHISTGLLERVELAERAVKKLSGAGQVRVRAHGDLARIEVSPWERHLFFDEQLLDNLNSELRAMGFTHISLDLAGYRRGSLNPNSRRKQPLSLKRSSKH